MARTVSQEIGVKVHDFARDIVDLLRQQMIEDIRETLGEPKLLQAGPTQRDRALGILKKHGKLTSGEIAIMGRMPRQSVSSVLCQLQKAGLVKSDSDPESQFKVYRAV